MNRTHTLFTLLIVSAITIFTCTPLLQAATFTVTNTADTGAGSLRQALLNAATNTDADTIEFDISGVGPFEIVPGSYLPVIMYPVTLDATTQTGYSGSPLIYITTTNLTDNSSAGIEINGAANCTIAGLRIQGFGNGILLLNANSNTLESCVCVSNSYGIQVYNSSYNTIGGTNANGNVCSANSQHGIYQNAAAYFTAENTYLGNRLGTDAAGTNAWPNGVDGINIQYGNNTYIGNGSDAGRNVASGNIGSGIKAFLWTGAGEGLIINNNMVGVDITGSYAIKNGWEGSFAGYGIYSCHYSGQILNNVIGGHTNSVNHHAVYIQGAENDFAMDIAGNHIGVDIAGSNTIANAGGIWCNAPNITIGGTNLSDRNIIAGNTNANIELNGSWAKNCSVINNYIGVNKSGSTALSPQRYGINLAYVGTNHIIQDNIISGHDNNRGYGLQITPNSGVAGNLDVRILGNHIGSDATGLTNLGNTVGIEVGNNCVGVTIGGTNSADRNIIGGTTDEAISMRSASNSVIIGNYIGVGADGSTALTNESAIYVNSGRAYHMQILNNVMANNRNYGMNIQGTNHIIQGNLIGTDATGTNACSPCNYQAIRLYLTDDCQIGGTNITEANIICSSRREAIQLYRASNHEICGNFIGTDRSGTLALTNEDWGISVMYGSTNNIIGSTNNPQAANLIYYNQAGGIMVDGGTNTTMIGNSILHNGGPGIDLGDDGPTPNDANDPDLDANLLQNYPVITNVANNATNIQGTLNSMASKTYRLDFYVSKADETNGSARAWLATTDVTTDGSGDAAFDFATGNSIENGWLVNATATDPDGNTSEFSADVAVTGSSNLPINHATIYPLTNQVEKFETTGQFFVEATPASAAWTAETSTAWITLTNNSNTGNAYVSYTASSNTNTYDRTGTVSVADATFTVIQSATLPTILTVNITPADAVTDGARWRTGTSPYTNWYESAHAITNIPAGDYTIIYNTLTAWVSPPTNTLTVSNEVTTQVTGVYTAYAGSIKVTLIDTPPLWSHPEWKLEGSWYSEHFASNWQSNNAVLTNVPIGIYTQICHSYPGYNSTSNIITVTDGQLSHVTSRYYQATGTVTTVIEPEAVRNAGVQWFFSYAPGTNYNSGESAGAPVGSISVTGTDLPGWITPTQSILIVEDTTTNVTITYENHISLYTNALAQDVRTFQKVYLKKLTNGASIELELYHDVDNNGTIDPADARLLSLNAEDGVTAPFGARSIIGDSNTNIDGNLTLDIPYYNLRAARQTAGNYIWQYATDDGTNHVAFSITQAVSAHAFSGQVVDYETDTPVPNARVHLEYSASAIGDSPAAWTDTNGTFTLHLSPNVSPAQARMLIAEAPGYLSMNQLPGTETYVSAYRLTNAPTSGTNTISTPLKLMRANPAQSIYALTGTVYGVDGTTNALPGVTVRFQLQDRDQNAITAWDITSDDGSFSLPALNGATGMVLAVSPDLNLNNWVGSGTELIVSQNVPNIEFTCLRPDTLVKGQLRDSDVPEILGIDITLHAGENPPRGSMATTLMDAYYEVGVLGGTNYTAEVSDIDLLAQQVYPIPEFTIAVTNGDLVYTNGDTYAPDSEIVSGTVYDSHTNAFSDGIVAASLTNITEWASGCRLDFDGYYQMILTDSVYRVFTSPESFTNYTAGESNVNLSASTVSNVNFFLTQQAQLSGYLRFDTGGTNAVVNLYRVTNTSPRQVVFVNSTTVNPSNDTYNIGLTPGYDYILQGMPAAGSDYVPEYYFNAYRVEKARLFSPTNTDPITSVNFIIQKGATITGRVVDESDAPKAYASITIYTNATHITGTAADTNGEYRIVVPPALPVKISAEPFSHDGGHYGRMYYDQAITADSGQLLTMQPGDTTNINFQLFAAGALNVTLAQSPTNPAIAPRWRLANSSFQTNWIASSQELSSLPTGTYTTEYETVTGWRTPPANIVTISAGTTNSITTAYTQMVGSVQTILTPAGAVNAGAKWQIATLSTNWYDSGTTITNIPAGTYTQTFKTVTHWFSPAAQPLTVHDKQTTATTGTYTKILYGRVKCTISPDDAVTEGARWRLTTGTNTDWQISGTTVYGVPAGSYSIAFKDVSRWRKPDNDSIQVHSNQLTGTTATYRRLNIPNDFDNDGKSDIGCYAPDSGWWYIYKSLSETLWVTNYAGGDGTLAVTGDFDGDGYCDYGTYYPPTGLWQIMRSTAGEWINNFGFEGTVPVTGDFDGDGTYDFGCYYDQTGWWFIYKSGTGFWTTQFGYGGTLPFTGDFDGDGIGDFGCYFPDDGWWYIYKSSIEDLWTTQFGYEGTTPVTGDFDGDGIDDFGCYYPAGGNWYIQKSRDGFFTTQFGYAGTSPIAGDYDGDGISDFGCYYPPTGHWYVYMSATQELWINQFGYDGTMPLK